MKAGLFAKLVKHSDRTPSEVLAKLCAALSAEGGPSSVEDKLRKYLGCLKAWLFGDEQHEPTREAVLALAEEVANTDAQLLLVRNLPQLDFETRKDAAQVFGAVVRIRAERPAPDRAPGARYVEAHPEILTLLFKGCVPGARPGPQRGAGSGGGSSSSAARAARRGRGGSSSPVAAHARGLGPSFQPPLPLALPACVQLR